MDQSPNIVRRFKRGMFSLMVAIQDSKIYVVDDDPSVRKALKRLLRAVAKDVESFASAEEFLQAFSAEGSICLILDVYLGGMSGFELYHHLVQSGYSLPVVFITAQYTVSIREETRKLTGAKILRKPFNAESLFDAIREAVPNQ
jgi:FixJ family two-component response regulator